jgi:tetratricopeptide (TPR) repeat protein
MKRLLIATIAVILVLLIAPAELRAQASLAAAKDLYASAAYEEALALLGRLKQGPGAEPSSGPELEQYRALCLLALGRTSEAERAIEAVITAQPFYRPDETEASPRVRATFHEVRQRMLPAIVHEKYAMAKSTFDRQEYAAAAEQFRGVVALADDSDLEAVRRDPTMVDLRTLADGFLSLAAAAPVPPPPPPEPEPEPAPVPVYDPLRIYSSSDADVTPPVTVKQNVPRWPGNPASASFPANSRGVLEITIGVNGEVQSAVMRRQIEPNYDALLIKATKDWRYRPATRDGKPVRYMKVIQVSMAAGAV